MELHVLDETLALARLAADAAVPPWVAGRDFLAVVRTPRELSIVCRDDAVPSTHTEVQRGFRALAVVGTLDFALTGIVASLAAPLAAPPMMPGTVSPAGAAAVLLFSIILRLAHDRFCA